MRTKYYNIDIPNKLSFLILNYNQNLRAVLLKLQAIKLQGGKPILFKAMSFMVILEKYKRNTVFGI